MSYANLLGTDSKVVKSYLPVFTPSTVILQNGGAVSAPLTGTFVSPASSNNIIQLFLNFAGAGSAVGTGTATLTYTNSDDWGLITIPASALTTDGPYTQVAIGGIPAGTQTFTFTPTTGMNLGATGEIAVRVGNGIVV